MEQIRDSAIFEMYNGAYILAEDSGYFTVGEVRDERMYWYIMYRDQTITSQYNVIGLIQNTWLYIERSPEMRHLL